MDVPPSSHFIYIPVMLVLGIVLGFVMGSRATRDQIRMDEQKAAERERKKAARRAVVADSTPDDATK
ncbi:MAG: hypothetical protein SF187_30730 [Deltaproteobacteria bacterium]|nr:hypothetical protein [Deltaproteobacteria bacterium]